jgi:two-component system sensor histidine kinase/response regulator
MKQLFILYFFTAIVNSATADAPIQDTSSVNHLNKRAAAAFSFDPDSAFYFAQQSIIQSRRINYPAGLAKGLFIAGEVNCYNGETKAAIRNLDDATSIYKKLNDHRGVAACYLQYGHLFNLLADYKKARLYLDKALELDRQFNDEHALSYCYKGIGAVLFSQGHLSPALDYYYKALFIAVKNHDQVLKGELYNNIGVILKNMEVYPNALKYIKNAVWTFKGTRNLRALGAAYENMGEVFLEQSRFDDALIYLHRAHIIDKKLDEKDGLSSVFADLGLCYAHKYRFTSGIRYLDTCLYIAKKYKMVYNQADAFVGYAALFNLKKDFKKAYPYALKGKLLSMKLGNLSLKANADLQLSKVLAGLGKGDSAYQSLKEYIELKKRLKDNESIEKLTSYNYELNFSVKKRLLLQQQQADSFLHLQTSRLQKYINLIFFFIIIALIVVSSIFLIKHIKNQKVNALLNAKNIQVSSQKAVLDQQTDKLTELNSLKDRLIGILAHDLRAPLSTLTGLFSLLQDDTISHAELLDMIPNVIKKLEYTSGFLDTLLYWINSQMDNFHIAVKSFCVEEILDKVVKSLEDQIIQKKITVIKESAPNLTALADPDSVGIVIRNLLNNAIKFCDEKDKITVSASLKDTNILVQVRDTGTGMTIQQVKKLFTGKVTSKSGTRMEAGSGMGLLFCKDLVEKWNGKISVKSILGTGTEFSFTIPVGDGRII